MENFKYKNKSFIMPMSAFDPFRTSWFECSSCRNPLFEKQIMSKIPHICHHCGVHLENIICDEQAFHILYKTGKIVNVNKEFTRNDLNIKINDDIPEYLLNMKLIDMFCKHIIRNSQDNIKTKADKLYTESLKLGYNFCEWGVHSGHPSDISFHTGIITKMEKDNYNHAVRIFICKYDFCDTSIVWVDNLHSAIKYIREYGKDVRLRDIPFYVVDISDYQHPIIQGYNDSLRDNYEDILGAVSCAYKRFRRSNSKELIEIGYTLKDFLCDNPMLYTEVNTHLGLINECAAK